MTSDKERSDSMEKRIAAAWAARNKKFAPVYEAKKLFREGFGKNRKGGEKLLEAENDGITQKEMAKELGQSVGWVNACLQWARAGFPPNNGMFAEASKKSRDRAKKRVHSTEQGYSKAKQVSSVPASTVESFFETAPEPDPDKGIHDASPDSIPKDEPKHQPSPSIAAEANANDDQVPRNGSVDEDDGQDAAISERELSKFITAVDSSFPKMNHAARCKATEYVLKIAKAKVR